MQVSSDDRQQPSSLRSRTRGPERSTHYASGYALRFPRLVRVRFDKTAEDADSVERVGMLAGVHG